MDYYVDESGEWDPWVSRIPDNVYSDNNDLLGEVFVDTVDTVKKHTFYIRLNFHQIKLNTSSMPNFLIQALLSVYPFGLVFNKNWKYGIKNEKFEFFNYLYFVPDISSNLS